MHFALNHSFWLFGCLSFVGSGNVKGWLCVSLLDVVWFLVVGLGRGPWLENKFWFARGICACVAIGLEIGVHRVLALTFQSMIVHFFVALAPKNCPRALASTTSRSDWRPPASKSKSAQWFCKLVLFCKYFPFPKTKRQKCTGFQGRQSGPSQYPH